MIYITEKAAKKLEEVSNADGIGHCSVRVRVLGGGCAGFTHDIEFDNKINEMDEVIDFDNVKIIVDPISYQYLDEVSIDYVESEIGAGFKFNNPNVKGSCGCGSSVSF